MSCVPIQSDLTLDPPNSLPEQPLDLQDSPFHQTAPRPPRPSGHGGKQLKTGLPLLVHCHLCWDWVWQRPQQFMSRLSRRHKVLFVETLAPDPQLAAPLVRFRHPPDYPAVTILRVQFPHWRWQDGAYIDLERRRLVQEFLLSPAGRQFTGPIQWFYDPMAVSAFGGQMGEVLTVYDCMDELSKFRGAPPEILTREQELLKRADLVFTGGRRLFENKSQFHDNCHCYGCGVEAEHFGRAHAAQTAVPPEVAALPQPVLGYFGVIDERIDYELLARLAQAKPDWSIVLIGPTAKVEESRLPRRPNLHWLGQRAYAELPALCKAFDLCLMPFALNEATEFINPTKALEYMATGRPIISTAVADVVANFGSVVSLARNPAEFIRLCEKALDEPDAEAIGRGLKMARENSWDLIVARLEAHLEEALARRPAAA